ncbi:MAG: hypothetical protein OXC67_01675 [Flavobacteriaceae bacterium]|nr:hypothetical protein [Flavobacteriaceae bacterium]MCY4297795.1 hypothetical protein [Flavobacteriaceae bacterium]
MFGKDKIIIAVVFILAYTIFIIWSYRRDRKKSPAYFKGSLKILGAIILIVLILFLLKLFVSN